LNREEYRIVRFCRLVCGEALERVFKTPVHAALQNKIRNCRLCRFEDIILRDEERSRIRVRDDV